MRDEHADRLIRRILLMTLTVTATVPSMLPTVALATAISDKYAKLGGASGFLGAPTIVESTAPDGVGRYRHFQGGSIYWHPKTGAHEVHGLIREKWAGLGWEKSDLGYPMTDEIDSFDGAGRVSKFQGGQLFWSAKTNQIAILRSTDLIVDLPFAVGEIWGVVQANGVKLKPKKDSHMGAWAYAWDFVPLKRKSSWFLSPLGVLAPSLLLEPGRPFRSAADGKIVWVLDHFKAGDGDDNRIAIRLGEGRYASYLHALKDSYHKRFGAQHLFWPNGLPWERRPAATGGAILAETGNVCEIPCRHHLHFAVTTKPDIKTFVPFETIPVSFRNYSVSKNGGSTWTYVPTGVPRTGDLIRREKASGATAPIVQSSKRSIRYGTVSGTITFKTGGYSPPETGTIAVIAVAPWGEPLATTKIPYSLSPFVRTQISYNLEQVPAFDGLHIKAVYEGSWSAGAVSGETDTFNLAPYGSEVADVSLTVAVIH